MTRRRKYEPESLRALCLKLISENVIRNMRELYALIGVSEETFLNYFPSSSEEYTDIYDALIIRKAEIKNQLKRQWLRADAAPMLQTNVMKLLADTEELEALGQVNRNNNTQAGTLQAQIIVEQVPTTGVPSLSSSETDVDTSLESATESGASE